MKYLWKINQDRSYISIDFGNEIRWYKKTDIKEKYREVKDRMDCNYRFISRIHQNRAVRILFQNEESDTSDYSSSKDDEDEPNEENEIRKAIQWHTALAIYDVSIR